MQRLIFKEIKILSRNEQRARIIKFHPKMNLIKGENHVGKSSLIKSIYYTLGATPNVMHPKWIGTEPICLLTFTIDDVEYSILRRKSFFAIYNSSRECIGTFDKITDGLGPFLSNLLKYNIELPNKENRLITPPPAYFFLPFYLDQDSWYNPLSSFARLTQLKGQWKASMLHFHTGIKPNEYYQAKGQIEIIKDSNRQLESQMKVSKNVMSKLNEQMGLMILDADLDNFKKEIAELLEQYEQLKVKGDVLKRNIVDLNNEKIHLQKHVRLLEKSIDELKEDYNYALSIPDEEIDCPTCGAVYSNSFVERFSIARDEDRCHDLLEESKMGLRELETKIKKQYELYEEHAVESNRILNLLDSKQGEVHLKDIIRNEGKKDLKTIVEGELDVLRNQMAVNEVEINELKNEMKSYEDRKHKSKIEKFYRELMRDYLDDLGVETVPEKSYKTITSKIADTGSGAPRAYLAYYYSLLGVINKYSTSTFCPIILDSPNQQEQDKKHWEMIKDFIIEKQPLGSQLILGTVEFGDRQFHGKTIELKEKYHLLQKDDYEEVSHEINTLLGLIS
ncbi:hypothetical protein [Paenibacillus oleatilyticus]|uniref:AAA domain-containing protein n=1 Tax=Paenibacillus oleatilyticus TaxID=2594886 RepID=A0ABV4V5A5_9BACL